MEKTRDLFQKIKDTKGTKMGSIKDRDGRDLTEADDTTVMAKSEKEWKTLLMKVKESEKAGLKLNIQKPKIMASVLILHSK